MIFKKDIGLLVLILLVGSVVAIINPRFLLAATSRTRPTRSACSALSPSRRPSSSSSAASSSRSAPSSRCWACVFIDLIVNLGVHWAVAALIVVGAGMLMGLVHGALVAKAGHAAFRRDACARC